VVVGGAARDQLVDGALVVAEALRLKERPLVPLQIEPLEAVQDRRERGVDVALLIGVVDAEQVFAAVAPREQPVEERRAHAADVEKPGRRRRESRAYRHDTLSPGLASAEIAFAPAASTMPSERPNFICRGFRFAITTTCWPTSTAGSG